MDVTVQENPGANRYVAVGPDGAEVGFVEYVDHHSTRVLFHTEVDPAVEGQGIGGTLAREVLEQALAAGQPLRVTCPFLVSWIERNPEYADRLTVG